MEKSRVLQEALHVLAQEHHQLEQSVGAGVHAGVHGASTAEDDDDDEFYDCDNDDKGIKVELTDSSFLCCCASH